MADILKKEMLLERWDFALFDKSSSKFRPKCSEANRGYIVYAEDQLRLELVNNGCFITLADVLRRFDIQMKANQALAGWHFNNFDPRNSMFEIMELKNGAILIHFLGCEKYLLDDIYKGRLPERGHAVLSQEEKRYCQNDVEATMDIYESYSKNKK